MERRAKIGAAALLATAIASALVGGCVDNSMHRSAEQEAYNRLRGTGNVPGISQESAQGTDANGNKIGFQPSDSPPKCLPNGTVTYEVYDGAANMRYWVFRWPEDKGYSIVPRLMLDEEGRLVPYTPPRFTPTEDDVTVTEGEVETDD